MKLILILGIGHGALGRQCVALVSKVVATAVIGHGKVKIYIKAQFNCASIIVEISWVCKSNLCQSYYLF
jgi:hypothetical protein